MAVTDNPRPPAALPPGTRLHEFELRRVLGIGGFGIVYLAFDHALEREVAIKEYMPSSLVGRSSGALLSLLSETHAESFSLGLRSFLNEARLLARFDAPGLVKVHRYWEANNTAYMAMPFYAGSNLHAVRRRMAQPPDEAWLRQLLGPLLDALERLHREGVYHRDISPDNVILQPDGQPVLLDFGAARRVVLTEKSVALTAILKPAYAPIEQYAEAGAVKQGAWTDLYALGATLHFLLLGRAPPPATARAVDDDMRALASQPELLARCTPGFLQAIDWMLAPRPAHRPQTVAALREALVPRPVAPANPGGDDNGHIDLGDEDATVLLPRRDEPTVLLPRKPVPPLAGGDEPTVFVPRPAGPPPAGGDEPTVLLPRKPARAMPAVGGDEPTVLLPRKDEVTVLLPLGGEAAAQADALHEATMRLPPPRAGRLPAPARPEALQARPDDALPRPAPPKSVLPWVAAAGLVAASLVAAWLMLKPAGPAPAAHEPPSPAAPASAAAAATPTPADASPAPTAAEPVTAVASTSAPAAGGKAPAALPPLVRPTATTTTKAAPTANDTEGNATKAGRAAATTSPEPAPVAEPMPAAATGGPPSLATSITRLPPATEPAVAAAAPLVATGARPGAEPARSPAPSAASPPAAAAPLAAAPRGGDTPVPRAANRDGEPVLLQARALSPAERCDGRAAAALWACIDRLCRAEPGLREHADCARARRELGAVTP